MAVRLGTARLRNLEVIAAIILGASRHIQRRYPAAGEVLLQGCCERLQQGRSPAASSNRARSASRSPESPAAHPQRVFKECRPRAGPPQQRRRRGAQGDDRRKQLNRHLLRSRLRRLPLLPPLFTPVRTQASRSIAVGDPDDRMRGCWQVQGRATKGTCWLLAPRSLLLRVTERRCLRCPGPAWWRSWRAWLLPGPRHSAGSVVPSSYSPDHRELTLRATRLPTG